MGKCSKCGKKIEYNHYKLDKDNVVWCWSCWANKPSVVPKKRVRRKKNKSVEKEK